MSCAPAALRRLPSSAARMKVVIERSSLIATVSFPDLPYRGDCHREVANPSTGLWLVQCRFRSYSAIGTERFGCARLGTQSADREVDRRAAAAHLRSMK